MNATQYALLQEAISDFKEIVCPGGRAVEKDAIVRLDGELALELLQWLTALQQKAMLTDGLIPSSQSKI